MLIEIMLLVIALWFVFGAGFWGIVLRFGLRFEPRHGAAAPKRATLGDRVAAGAVGKARRAERDPLPHRQVPLTWA